MQGSGIKGVAEAADLFGFALAAGDFDGDLFDDLAIGVPGENSGAGAVNVLYGSSDRLRSFNDQIWAQRYAGA